MKQHGIKAITCIAGLVLAAAIVALSACSFTGGQPKQAPAKTCLDCHPKMMDKFKDGHVHAPVKEKKCGSCHRPHGIVGGLFQVAPQPDLCYQCHEKERPAEYHKSVHQPVAKGNCTVCHEPHNSPYAMLLKDGRDKICWTCHQREIFTRKHRHAPLEQGCGTCHEAHLSKHVSLLKMEPDAQCRSCHEVKAAAFTRAHFDLPVRSGCLQCHSPHSTDRPGLLKKNVHEPVLKGECRSCHGVNKENDITTKDKADKLCLTCHETHVDGKKTAHQPYVRGRCTVCHAVHASDYPAQMAKPPDQVCLTCHEKGSGLKKTEPKIGADKGLAQDQEGAKKSVQHPPAMTSVHRPVSEGRCLDCHLGHVSDQDALLITAQNKLCFNCHDRAVFSAGGGSHPPEKGRECATCHVPHASSSRALLRGPESDLCFSCHRKTADERGMFSQHRPFTEGKCGGCHQMHRPAAAGFLKAKNNGRELCLPCHKDVGNNAANTFKHPPVARGRCGLCHVPHAADYDPLMKQDTASLCYTCHGTIKREVKRAEVGHRPVVDGDCVTCHSAHGSTHEKILKKGQPMLCLTCHTEVAEYWRKGVVHKPAVKGCLQCHSPHGSAHQWILKKKSGALCSQCHKTGTKAFVAAHHGIRPQPDSCVTCHDAHGGPDKSLLYPVGHDPFKQGSCSPCHPGRAK